MCPIIGEIQMHELSNASNSANQTLSNRTRDLYSLFKSKNIILDPANKLALQDYKGIIEEIWTNDLQLRQPASLTFTDDEKALMNNFMLDYYHMFLQGNDTVTQLSVTGFFNNLIFTLEERAKYLNNYPNTTKGAEFLKT